MGNLKPPSTSSTIALTADDLDIVRHAQNPGEPTAATVRRLIRLGADVVAEHRKLDARREKLDHALAEATTSLGASIAQSNAERETARRLMAAAERLMTNLSDGLEVGAGADRAG